MNEFMKLDVERDRAIQQVKLVDICNPKQWKTIASSLLLNEGFPVYGANGKIGYYSEYTHELPTILITCRGATCGSLNICEEKSYVNGNAMALDELDSSVDLKYLFYVLRSRGFSDVISGSAQPQITRQNLKNLKIPLPPLAEQQKIAEILDAADALRQKDQQLIDHYTTLSQSLFLEMFGDPVTNPMGWEVKTLKSIGFISTGNTPPREKVEYYGEYIEWIKTNNINTPYMYLTKAEEYLSETGMGVGRIVDKGSLLVTCIAGSKKVIGNVAISNRKVAFNQQINSFTPDSGNILFFYSMFLVGQKHIQSFSTNGMKGMINKSKFESIDFINPPITLQNQFAQHIEKIEKQKQQAQASLVQSNNLFNSLLQKAFTGELTA